MRMKKADLRKALENGTIVAIGQAYGDEIPTSARRAKITGLDAKRRVYSGGRDWRGRIVTDGVRVRYETPHEHDKYQRPIRLARSVGRDEFEDTEDVLVAPKEVLGTWEQYQSALIAQQATREQKKTRTEKLETESRQLANVLREMGFAAEADYYLPQSHGGKYEPGYFRGVRLSIDEARKLVEYLQKEKGLR